MYYKSKLMFITSVFHENKKINIELNNKLKFVLDDMGASVKCGRPCIVNFNLSGEIKNFYLIDSFSKPYQIYGSNDILLDGAVIYDETKELLKFNAYAIQFCIQSFNILHKLEIELNKIELIDLENKIFDFVFNNPLGFKSLKKEVVKIIDELFLENEIKQRIQDSINIAPMPRSAVDKKIFINLEDYPLSKMVVW